jgi:hypothetical protein
LPPGSPLTDRRSRGRPPSPVGSPVYRKRHERIEIKDAVAFSEALNFARHIGREPNVFVTIQWKHAECDRPAADRTRRLLNLLAIWSRRRTGLPPVWAYAREVGIKKGEHLHLLTHVPSAVRAKFDREVRGWIEGEATGEVRQSAVRIMSIRDGDLHGNLKGYLLKDGTDEVRDKYWIAAHHRRSVGVLLGKRVKVSHSIWSQGPRKRAYGLA